MLNQRRYEAVGSWGSVYQRTPWATLFVTPPTRLCAVSLGAVAPSGCGVACGPPMNFLLSLSMTVLYVVSMKRPQIKFRRQPLHPRADGVPARARCCRKSLIVFFSPENSSKFSPTWNHAQGLLQLNMEVGSTGDGRTPPTARPSIPREYFAQGTKPAHQDDQTA